jgi:hypothetical protein
MNIYSSHYLQWPIKYKTACFSLKILRIDEIRKLLVSIRFRLEKKLHNITWQHCFGNMADDFPTELFLIFHNISNESNVSRIVYVESNIQ